MSDRISGNQTDPRRILKNRAIYIDRSGGMINITVHKFDDRVYTIGECLRGGEGTDISRVCNHAIQKGYNEIFIVTDAECSPAEIPEGLVAHFFVIPPQ